MREEYNFVCIEEEELNRLNAIASANININNQDNIYNNVIDKINRIDKKLLYQELFVYDLNGELKYFELELQRKYVEQLSELKDFKSQIIELFRLQKDDYTKLIKEQNKKIDSIINKISEGFNIDNIFNNSFLEKKKNAEILCNDLNKIILNLENIPNREKYFKEINKIRYLFNQCIKDFKNGFYESSMSIARLVYSNIIDFRNHFIEIEEKIFNLYNVLNIKIQSLKENLNNRNIFIEYDNKEFNLDLEFWSNNSINKINNNIFNLEKSLLENIDEEELNNEYNKIINYENELKEIINNSKINIISSQIRGNLASKCIDILENSGFEILESNYINNDFRNNFRIVLENILKDKFIILIKSIFNTLKTTLSIELEEYIKDVNIKLSDIKEIFLNNGIIIANI